MVNEYMKKCSTSFDIMEIQIKTSGFLLNQVRMAILSRTETTNAREDTGERDSLHTFGI
jgi:tRNA U38,U39,U40 pseudouridine synthase TruA